MEYDFNIIDGIVTILILIDGFLQFYRRTTNEFSVKSHNPYFNRWFSAIRKVAYFTFDKDNVTILILIDGFLQFI